MTAIPAAPAASVTATKELVRIPRLDPPERSGLVRSTQIIPDPLRDRVYQVFVIPPGGRHGPSYSTHVNVLELSTGGTVAESHIAMPISLDYSGGPKAMFDAGRGLLIFPLGEDGRFALVDVERLARPAPPIVGEFTVDHGALSRKLRDMERVDVAGRSKIRLLFSAFPSIGGPPGSQWPLLVQYDVAGRAVDWTLEVRLCGAGAHLSPFAGSLVMTSIDGRRVYVTCLTKSDVTAVVKIHLDPSGRPDPDEPQEVFPGVGKVHHAVADPGSERVALLGPSEVTVFDGRAGRFVGVSALPGSQARRATVDPDSGRLYVLNGNEVIENDARKRVERGGLQAMEVRATPPGQFVNLDPALAYPAETTLQLVPAGDEGRVRVIVRRAAHYEDFGDRTFVEADDQSWRVRDGAVVWLKDEPFYRVIEIRLPDFVAPSFDDIDRFTDQVGEKPGVSEANFDASAGGYAVRTVLTGGVGGPLRQHSLAETMEDYARTVGVLPACWLSEREVVGGSVEDVHLTELVAVARGTPEYVNETTAWDAEAPAKRCQPPALGAGEATPDETGADIRTTMTSCVGDDQVRDDGRAPGSYIEVSCGRNERRASAEAVAGSGSGVLHGRGWVDVRVGPGAAGGLEATVTAVAQRVELTGLVSIESVRSIARVSSAGRSGLTKASLERSVCGIRAGTHVIEGCIPAEEAASHINQGLAGRGYVRVPEADPRLFRGSKGGYLAGVAKITEEALEDQLMVGDHRVEVPGLLFVHFTDSTFFGHSRQTVALAGVRAVVGFGVRCISPYAVDIPTRSCTRQAGPSQSPAEALPTGDALPPVTTNPPVLTGEHPIESTPVEVVRRVLGWTLRTAAEGIPAMLVWALLGLPLVIASRRSAYARMMRR